MVLCCIVLPNHVRTHPPRLVSPPPVLFSPKPVPIVHTLTYISKSEVRSPKPNVLLALLSISVESSMLNMGPTKLAMVMWEIGPRPKSKF